MDGGKKRILFIQPGTKSFAGIQRVIDDVCTQLGKSYAQVFDIDVLYTSKYDNVTIGARPYGKIDRPVSGRFQLLRTIRSVAAAKPYDLIVVPQVEPLAITWLACLGLQRRFALHLHGNPKMEATHAKAKLLFGLMQHAILGNLAAIFGTSPRQLRSFQSMYPSNVPTHWLPNPVRTFEDGALAQDRDPREVTFVNVGRYGEQKGQDLLIDAFAKVHARRPATRLKLVGYGVTKPELEQRIASNGLQSAVELVSLPNDPAPALGASDIYVSTSRWEGWSLAICEALRFGLPVVSTDCEFGPSDILSNTRLGRLVPVNDEASLVDAMCDCCDHLEQERAHAQYRRDYVEQFSIERVVHVHAKALHAAASKRSRARAFARGWHRIFQS